MQGPGLALARALGRGAPRSHWIISSVYRVYVLVLPEHTLRETPRRDAS